MPQALPGWYFPSLHERTRTKNEIFLRLCVLLKVHGYIQRESILEIVTVLEMVTVTILPMVTILNMVSILWMVTVLRTVRS